MLNEKISLKRRSGLKAPPNSLTHLTSKVQLMYCLVEWNGEDFYDSYDKLIGDEFNSNRNDERGEVGDQ